MYFHQINHFPYQYALDSEQNLVNISNVTSGLKCNCYCITCGAQLVARKGPLRIDHFAHHASLDGNCAGGLETELHLRAKQIIEKNKLLMFPGNFLNSNTRIKTAIDSVEIEVYRDGRKPDLTVTVEGIEYFVEIAVTHFADSVKKAHYRQNGISAIEIDLSRLHVNNLEDIDEALNNGLFNYTEDTKIYWLSLNVCSPIGQKVKASEDVTSKRLVQKNQELEISNESLLQRINENETFLASKQQLVDGIKTLEQLENEIAVREKQSEALTENIKHQMDVIINNDGSFSVLNNSLRQRYDQIVKEYDEKVALVKLIRMKADDAKRELAEVNDRLEEASSQLDIQRQRELEIDQSSKSLLFLLEELNCKGIDQLKAAQYALIIEEVEESLTAKKESLLEEINSLKRERDESRSHIENELGKLNQQKDKLVAEIQEFRQLRDSTQQQAFATARLKHNSDKPM